MQHQTSPETLMYYSFVPFRFLSLVCGLLGYLGFLDASSVFRGRGYQSISPSSHTMQKRKLRFRIHNGDTTVP